MTTPGSALIARVVGLGRPQFNIHGNFVSPVRMVPSFDLAALGRYPPWWSRRHPPALFLEAEQFSLFETVGASCNSFSLKSSRSAPILSSLNKNSGGNFVSKLPDSVEIQVQFRCGTQQGGWWKQAAEKPHSPWQTATTGAEAQTDSGRSTRRWSAALPRHRTHLRVFRNLPEGLRHKKPNRTSTTTHTAGPASCGRSFTLVAECLRLEKRF